MKVIKFPSIDQFRTVVSNVLRHYNFEGLDENGEAIYDPSKPKPVLKFIGTVKLHGTNFGINFNDIDGMWCQSKENIITVTKDNAGSAGDVMKEDLDILTEAQVEPKEINKYISDIARKYFFARFNESVGLNK